MTRWLWRDQPVSTDPDDAVELLVQRVEEAHEQPRVSRANGAGPGPPRVSAQGARGAKPPERR